MQNNLHDSSIVAELERTFLGCGLVKLAWKLETNEKLILLYLPGKLAHMLRCFPTHDKIVQAPRILQCQTSLARSYDSRPRLNCNYLPAIVQQHWLNHSGVNKKSEPFGKRMTAFRFPRAIGSLHEILRNPIFNWPSEIIYAI